MLMNPSLFLVLDDETRLAGKAEIALERIDRLAPLRRREYLVGAGVDVGLVEVVIALGAGRERLHLAERLAHGGGA
jgi:hypothetical protein